MNEDLLSYDTLVREALHGVIRQVLQRVSQKGLPGKHYLVIKFLTQYSGVILSDSLREQYYPNEMTIILQYQFFDLQVDQESFSVTLSFNNVFERLTIPYEAVMLFSDPSVHFAIPFHFDASSMSINQEDGPKSVIYSPVTGKEVKRGEIVTLDDFRKSKREEERKD